MTIINLKRYYPYMTEDVTLEVSDEIAAALSICLKPILTISMRH